MNVAEKTLIDLSDSAEQTPTTPSPRVAPQDIHTLRLCLDLQVDALLHTLGAAAAVGAARLSDAPESLSSYEWEHETSGAPLPWRRWLAEDLDLACTLTATTLACDVAPRASLGSDPTESDQVEVVDDVLARYTTMRAMLLDLVDRARNDPQSWGGALRAALRRCEHRIGELQRHRTALVTSKATRSATTSRSRPGHYVPGDYLG